jgi:hypothetical protein
MISLCPKTAPDAHQLKNARQHDAFRRLRDGWGVENHGVDPDVEVIMSPDDWAAERDTQLETAVRLALEALQQRPAVRPPDTRTRPSKRRPPLPPRVYGE